MSIENLENIAKREENVWRLAAGLGLAILIVVAALVIAI